MEAESFEGAEQDRVLSLLSFPAILCVLLMFANVVISVDSIFKPGYTSRLWSWMRAMERSAYNENYSPYERLLGALDDNCRETPTNGLDQSREHIPLTEEFVQPPAYKEARVLCYVCMDREPVWAPKCGHILCAVCIGKLKGTPCPKCRKTIVPAVKIFM